MLIEVAIKNSGFRAWVVGRNIFMLSPCLRGNLRTTRLKIRMIPMIAVVTLRTLGSFEYSV